jgi:DNA polymerase-3 subunit gamma/tau
VELALIRLCYLQQAIQLSSEGNSISKKKVIDEVKSIAYRKIALFEVKETSANLPAASESYRNINKKSSEAKLIIETPALEKMMVAEENISFNEIQNTKPETTKLSALDKIRKQYKGNDKNESSTINRPIEQDELQKAWEEYIIKLKEEKNPAAQPFQLAVLRIKDENSFEAVTANNIEQKFIEQDRNKLFAFLQERLQNRLLHFNVTIEEKASDRPMIEIPLNAKEQFQKMAEQYPLINELKDRLRLELDY